MQATQLDLSLSLFFLDRRNGLLCALCDIEKQRLGKALRPIFIYCQSHHWFYFCRIKVYEINSEGQMHFKLDIPCGIEGAPTAFFLRSFTPAGNQPHLENLGEEGRESLLYCGREVDVFRAKLMQRGVPQFKIFPNPPRGDCGFFVFSALQKR